MKYTHKSQIVSIALLMCISTILPLSKKPLFGTIVDAFGSSTCMNYINKNMYAPFMEPVSRAMFGDIVASDQYQVLGKEAQCAVGILENSQLPIKKIPVTSIYASLVGALAQPDAIYINEEKLNDRPYGARRCALLHEAIHTKYHDMATHDVLWDLGWLISSVGTYKLLRWKYPQQSKILLGTSATIGNFVALSIISLKHKYYLERRADIEGHYASQCSACVQETADYRRKIFEQEHNPLRNQGYLWANDLEKIAQELEQEHKLCSYHSK